VTELRPHAWQTAATEAYFQYGGAVVWLDAGCGKSFVAAQIARRCPRPLVVAPAGVIRQTMAMFRSYGVDVYEAKEARSGLRPGVAFASYTWLQGANQAEFFAQFNPSDVLLDEFHLCRNLRTNSAAKRLNRFLVANWATRVAVFTASPWSRGLTDVAPGLRFALRKRAPLPPTADGLAMLAERLDADPAARAEWFARLAATPGVFLDSDGAGAYAGRVELTVTRRAPALELNAEQRLPDGYYLVGPAQAASVARNLSWGFWPRVTPRPSERYLEARRVWGATVRRVVDRGAADTELQVRDLRPDEYAAWAAVEAAEPPAQTEAVWETDAGLREVLAGVRPGTLVFAHSTELQRRAVDILGCPWHHAQGLDQHGVALNDATAPVVVASLTACHAGYNAQKNFSRVMFLDPVADQEVLKQAIARVARQGQAAPVVHVELVVCGPVVENALHQAVARARVAYEATRKWNPLLQLEGKLQT
jgi:hypothetical protein